MELALFLSAELFFVIYVFWGFPVSGQMDRSGRQVRERATGHKGWNSTGEGSIAVNKNDQNILNQLIINI